MAKINLLPALLACGAIATLARIGTAGLGANDASALSAAAVPSSGGQATATAPTAAPPGEPLQGQALVVAEGQAVIASAIYARAHHLLEVARQSGDAAKWLRDYQAKVAGEVTQAQQRTGLFTGGPELFSLGTNRAGELAAVASALLWLEHPELADKSPAYTLAALVEAVSTATTEGNPDEPQN